MDPAHYFDNAAGTPLLPEAYKAMQPYLQAQFHNPSALYSAGRKNRLDLEQFRHTIAMGLGAKPTELVFNAGGTEGNNIAIHGVMSAFANCEIITSPIEHESVLLPAEQYAHKTVAVNAKGIVDTADLQRLLTDKTVLVSIMYANNEIGSIQPLHDIAVTIANEKQRRKAAGIAVPLYFHTDACQASNYLDMQVARLGVDLLTINAGKIYGPKQTGALFIKSGTKLQPILQGGGQEWNMRSGTENLANIAGFATSWQHIRADHKQERRRLEALRDKAIHELQKVESVTVNGATHQKRLANNVHITVPGFDNEMLLMALDEQGFQVATGSACSASNDEPSHVLKAIGLSDGAAQSSLRITLGRHTTEASLAALVQNIVKLVSKQ